MSEIPRAKFEVLHNVIAQLIGIVKISDTLIDESEWIKHYGDGHNSYVICNNMHERLETALEEFEDFMMDIMPDEDGVISGAEKAQKLLSQLTNPSHVAEDVGEK